MAAKKETHTHRCECKHTKVRFCGDCKLVHCLDCKVEWSHEPCTRPHSYWSYQSLHNVYPTIGISGGPLRSTSGQFTITKNDGHELTQAACDHLNS